MTTTRFIQIHWLTSYPGALLNRDDSGLAKRLPFGNAVRGRVSSQCIKRHLRLAGEHSIEEASRNPWAIQNSGIPCGVRTKALVENRVMPTARAAAKLDGAASEGLVRAATLSMLKILYGEKAEDPKSRQALFFGEPEIAYLTTVATEALALEEPKECEKFFKDRDLRTNMRQLVNGAGLESALFGRMVTSDAASNRDAALHVAHALTVHGIARELDFVTAVDDLKSREAGDDSGAAGVFDAELTSGLYYGYAVIDVPLLIKNLSSDADAAAGVTERLIHLIAQVSPGAKKGSTAPYAWAEFLLVEAGSRQPRTLANAFRDAVPLHGASILGASVERIAKHLVELDTAYGSGESRLQCAVREKIEAVEAAPLNVLAKWTADQVRGGAEA